MLCEITGNRIRTSNRCLMGRHQTARVVAESDDLKRQTRMASHKISRHIQSFSR